MKTKPFTVLANQRALLMSRNGEKNLKSNSENSSVRHLIRRIFPKNLFCFHLNVNRTRQWFKLQIIKRRINSCKLLPYFSSQLALHCLKSLFLKSKFANFSIRSPSWYSRKQELIFNHNWSRCILNLNYAVDSVFYAVKMPKPALTFS